MYNLTIGSEYATYSPNISNLEQNYIQPELVEGSLSFREFQLDPNLKIKLIYKEFNESLSTSESEEDFKKPSDKALSEARILIPQLFMFEEPLISFLADGSIVFQWMKRPDSVLTFSVNGEETVIFAGILNRTKAIKKLSGTIPLLNKVLPKEIREILKDYFIDEKFQWIKSLQTQNH
jgi:hypothetical protein